MYDSKSILALIPARGGSKGLPKKNIKPFFGKPLIAWTIECAKQSRYIDKIIVSTDDDDIATVSKACGADVPFRRPKELATDSAKGIDVVMHSVNWVKEYGDRPYDSVVLLQPTSPLRTVKDVDGSIELLYTRNGGAVVSVCESKYNPFSLSTIPKNGSMGHFIKKGYSNRNRQDFDTYYSINGAVYAARFDYLKKRNDFLGPITYAYKMPKSRSVDIDDALDFCFAESIMRNNL